MSTALLWGIQLAVTTAFTMVTVGLALRLARPLMQALAMLWCARWAMMLVLFAYSVLGTGNVILNFVLETAVGALFGVQMFVGCTVVACADSPPDRLPPVTWGRGALLGAIVAASAHALNVALLDNSPVVAVLWARMFYLATYVCLLYGLLRLHGASAGARRRSSPLIAGTIGTLVFFVIDSVLRGRALLGATGAYDQLAAILSALLGTLVFGLATLLAALESERDAIAESAEQLRLSTLQAAESTRLQALGGLAAGVAHDFNNILSVILGGVDLVADRLADAPTDVHLELDEVKAAAKRGAMLTRRLLAFARQEPERPIEFTAGSALCELVPMLERLMGAGVRIQAVVSSTRAVRMAPAQFEQIALNLVVNARDAMPDGGMIDIRLEDVDSARFDALAVGGVRPGAYVRLTVCDSGVGMSPATQRALFEPFFTTKGARGTGLGLATVAGAVRDVNGAVGVQSAEGTGSAFEVWLAAVAA